MYKRQIQSCGQDPTHRPVDKTPYTDLWTRPHIQSCGQDPIYSPVDKIPLTDLLKRPQPQNYGQHPNRIPVDTISNKEQVTMDKAPTTDLWIRSQLKNKLLWTRPQPQTCEYDLNQRTGAHGSGLSNRQHSLSPENENRLIFGGTSDFHACFVQWVEQIKVKELN